MAKDSTPTYVTFRKFPEGDVVALFPAVVDGAGYITSYQHVGQHSDASACLLTELETPTLDEFVELFNELVFIGYSDLRLTL